MERLDKFVAERANIARKDAKSVIKRGRVSVNGVTEFSPERKVDTEEVCFDGVILPQSPFIYIIMNKPSGVLSASTDKRQQTVIDLVPETLRRKEIFPVGRLDKDTTGLLIITNDGTSAHRLLAPSSHIDKVYLAELDGEPTEETVSAFEDGIDLGDFKAMPAKLELLGGNKAKATVREGKFHQVKRMFASCGLNVMALKRVSFGGVSLPDDLKEGECRLLNAEEKKRLSIEG